MSADAAAVAATRRSLGWPTVSPAKIAAWLVPFALVAYLGLSGGGYDVVVRGQVGIAVWWSVLIAAMAGVLPALGRRGWIGLGLLCAFLGWTVLSLSWTESTERTVAEVSRVAGLAGVFLAGLAVVRGGHGRQVLNGLACAVGLVAAVAVLTRLQPSWFSPPDELADARRLSRPLNYWNGLAVFVAMGVAPMLAITATARTLLARSAAAAAVPVMVLCILLTVSRGGLLALFVASALFVAIAPDRLPKLLSLAVCGVGGAILVAAATSRSELRDGLRTGVAQRQGDELLLAVILVCAGAALLQLAVSLIDRHTHRPIWLAVSRARALRGGLIAALVVAAVGIAAGGVGAVDRAWQEFKEPRQASSVNQATTFGRLGSASGTGRYQFWQAAVRSASHEPLRGRGAGTYEYWWSRTRPSNVGQFVRDAHSLYLQSYAELGLIGLLLVMALVVTILGLGLRGLVRERVQDERVILAAAFVSGLIFVVMAGIDWMWQLTAIPALFFVFAAILLQESARGGQRLWDRIVSGGMAAVAVPLLAVSVSGATAIAQSQSDASRGDLADAYRQAAAAVRVQPYAASALMQQALVLEEGGYLDRAAKAAASATSQEPTNWRTWLVRSRLEAERGRTKQSIAFFTRARSLNPQSTIFRKSP